MFILSSSHLRGPLSSERCVQKGVRRLSRRRYAIRSAKVGLAGPSSIQADTRRSKYNESPHTRRRLIKESIMPFSRGSQLRSDPCQGVSGGVFRAQNPHFSPTRFHEDP